MIRVMVSIWCFLFLVSSSASAQERRWFLSQDYIKGFVDCDEEKISLTDSLDQISQKAFKDLYPSEKIKASFKKTIQSYARQIRKKVSPALEPVEAQTINWFLFEKETFVSQRSSLDESTLETMLLPKVLESKQGNCLTLSLIFLSIAEQLNVEAFGIVLPGHFFVRQKTKDGYQNLEMTNNGRILPDVFYRQVHLKNIYPENFRLLTKKEVIFVYISNLANYYKLKGYYDKAIELFNAALYVLPENASIYTNLGNAYERKKEIVKAGFQYQKALSINPYLCETHYNLGLLHFLYTGLKEEAYRHGQVVRKLGCPMNPDFERFLVEYELQKN